MKPLHVVALCVLCLPLLGCWSQQQAVFATCDTKLPYLGANPSITSAVPTRMTQCMDDAGYRTQFDSFDCRIAAVPRRSPYCYAPKDFFAGAGYWLESFFISGPKAPEN